MPTNNFEKTIKILAIIIIIAIFIELGVAFLINSKKQEKQKAEQQIKQQIEKTIIKEQEKPKIDEDIKNTDPATRPAPAVPERPTIK